MSSVDAFAALDAWVDELSGRGSGSAPWMDTRSRFDADYLVLQPTQWTQRDLEFRQPGVFRDATMPVGWHGVQGSIAGLAPGLVRPDKSHQEGGVRVNEEWDWDTPSGRRSSRAHERAHLNSMRQLYRRLTEQGGAEGAELARRLISETRSRFQLYERGTGRRIREHDIAYEVRGGTVQQVRRPRPSQPSGPPLSPGEIADFRRRVLEGSRGPTRQRRASAGPAPAARRRLRSQTPRRLARGRQSSTR